VIPAIGWLSSILLLVTIGTQVLKQWRDQTSKGVSIWLFIGQIGSSTGFVIYSAFVGSVVFIVTNAAMLVAAVVGLLLTVAQRKRTGSRSDGGAKRGFPEWPHPLGPPPGSI
jgi:uncharacterized protein with PQ loop repeat